MKLEVMQFTCMNGHVFDSLGLPEDSYAEFLLLSQSGKIAYLNAFDDETYDEVASLLEAHPAGARLSQPERLDLLAKIYGPLACDPASDTTSFKLGAHPVCPACGTGRMHSWAYKDPPEKIEREIQRVSHERWRLLDAAAKRTMLDRLIHVHT